MARERKNTSERNHNWVKIKQNPETEQEPQLGKKKTRGIGENRTRKLNRESQKSMGIAIINNNKAEFESKNLHEFESKNQHEFGSRTIIANQQPTRILNNQSIAKQQPINSQ